ncbi:MAG: hypothetical protein K2X77_13225 [Candidatus Obscuribacterales bacterium]|nr:hypothetical protein [Candidatus Obscuribacterales bacterium]
MPDEEQENWFSRLQERLAGNSFIDDIARTPLCTLEDCYDFLDAGWPPPHPPPTFAEVQRAYRSKLWRYNPNKPDLEETAVQYRTLMTAKIIEAYKIICSELKKDPEDGLEETEEGLLAECERLVAGWDGHWCGTPALMITQEYTERIAALKDRIQGTLP